MYGGQIPLSIGPTQNNSMTEEEAITEIKSQCAEENIENHDPDSVLEEALTSGDPGKLVDRYRVSKLINHVRMPLYWIWL